MQRLASSKLHHFAAVFVATVAVFGVSPASAADSPDVIAGQYIVELNGPGLLKQLNVTPSQSRDRQLFSKHLRSAEYMKLLDQQQELFLQQMGTQLGRTIKPMHRYRVLSNGMALQLSEREAKRLASMPAVRSVEPDLMHRLQTDSGPAWIEADVAWDGDNRGEGVVIGIIDSGINWNHPAFAEQGGDGYVHTNPLGRQLGLCSRSEVRCNNKLVGVYDYTAEGDAQGFDTTSHGSHVASIAAGNVRDTPFNTNTGQLTERVSGVAPHANIVSYKVCIADDPDTPEVDEAGCPSSGTAAALEQALLDGVDIINFSIGGPDRNPWVDGTAQRMLDAREAGLLVVTSGGNSGPNESTIGAPASAPWLVAVANITHDRRFVNALEGLSGGDTTPPVDLLGVGLTRDYGSARIVHARDFGNALCGTGTAELQSSCEAHTGASNPFAPGTFDGEIVVCDRGTYGRIEKGFNLRAAGAGGMVLANTAASPQTIVRDDHCLPALHLGVGDGDELRNWLGGGSNHQGRITGQVRSVDASNGDRLAGSSSRGPSQFVADQVKPDLAAPGSNVLGAGQSTSVFLSGTSMASPHVAGMLALALADNPSLTPDDLHAIAVGSARNDGMRRGAVAAGHFDVGGGRARVDLALRAGLTLRMPDGGFRSGSSRFEPATPVRDMNLPSVVDFDCLGRCQFSRTVSDLAGGGQWSVSTRGEARVQVSPESFALSAGGDQTLTIEVDVSDQVNQRVEGMVVLTPADAAISEFEIPVAAFASPGQFVSSRAVTTTHNSGSIIFDVGQLAVLNDLTFPSSGLGLERQRNEQLIADPTNGDPFDSEQGAYFTFVDIAAGDTLIAETIPQNNRDLDLFLGRDSNSDGLPAESEQLCSSTTSGSAELCQLNNLSAGRYWIVVQNWRAESDSDLALLRYVAVPAAGDELQVTAARQATTAGESFPIRVSWDHPAMRAGQRWIGLVGAQANGSTVATVPISVNRQVRVEPANQPVVDRALPLMLLDGTPVDLEVEPGEGLGKLFMDIPTQSVSGRAIDAVTVTVSADGPISLDARLVATEFAGPDVALAPFLPNTSASDAYELKIPVTTSEAQRLYVVPVNRGDQARRVTVTATLSAAGPVISPLVFQLPLQGLYFNPSRPGAGINLNLSDNDQLVLQWYTYLEDGTPTWLLAQGTYQANQMQWQADLGFFNYDGQTANFHDVGDITLTFSSPTDFTMSYTLHGVSGSEPYTSLAPDFSCENVGAVAESTGLWFQPDSPGFGYSVLSLADQQVQINYLYDEYGFPRWAIAQGEHGTALPASQFSGFCPSCAFVQPSSQVVGQNVLQADSAELGSVTTDLTFVAPLRGTWQRSGAINNLTPTTVCGG